MARTGSMAKPMSNRPANNSKVGSSKVMAARQADLRAVIFLTSSNQCLEDKVAVAGNLATGGRTLTRN